jgi:predicted HAD superfamily phosphohydrolase
VRREGGVAVAFNSNMYALPYANFALATLDMRFLHVLCKDFPDRDKMIAVARKWQTMRDEFSNDMSKMPSVLRTPLLEDLIAESSGSNEFIAPYLHYLGENNHDILEEIESIHSLFRERVRGRASLLG